MKKLIASIILSFCFVVPAKADDWRDNFGYRNTVVNKAVTTKQKTTRKQSTKENRIVRNIPVVRDIVKGIETGMASFYWQPQAVACGGRFNPSALTAAHRSYPCGSRVLVRNLRNGSTVTVTINDRGPFVAGRIIDLSKAAAQQIGMVGSGLTQVSIQRL